MRAYYVLRINDVSDPHNHLYSVVYPDNWDQGEGLVAAHAADHGYRLRHEYELGMAAGPTDLTAWLMYKDNVVVADAVLERRYE